MFTTIGEQKELDRLEAALPHDEEVKDGMVLFYFHHAEIKERGTGYIKVLAGRNYGGYAGIDNMVFDFPRLAFLGIMRPSKNHFMGARILPLVHGDIVAHDQFSFTYGNDDPIKGKLIATTRDKSWRIEDEQKRAN